MLCPKDDERTEGEQDLKVEPGHRRGGSSLPPRICGTIDFNPAGWRAGGIDSDDCLPRHLAVEGLVWEVPVSCTVTMHPIRAICSL